MAFARPATKRRRGLEERRRRGMKVCIRTLVPAKLML